MGYDEVQPKWYGAGNLAAALRTGRGVLVTVSSIDGVAASLQAAAGATVHVDQPTPLMLEQSSEQLYAGLGYLVATEVADAVDPDMLLGCLRPGQTASFYLDRLESVARSSLPPPPPPDRWTLDTLPLPRPVEEWARQLVADLADYRAGHLPWADVDRGALLYGPPGCGKTTFARALAASAGVPLIAASYASWEAGPEGKSDHTKVLPRMRMTFAEAARKAPCILFIDEIDSFMARGTASHNESWWRPIVNALLAELDGAAGREGVIVIAATNLLGEIDPALKRSGRLDRELSMALPDVGTLAKMLSAHLPALSHADLLEAAGDARGGSGADCERWAREARRAARVARRPVCLEDLRMAIQPPVVAMPDAARRRLAFHEAGHCVVAALTSPGSLVSVSIRPVHGRGSYLGGVEIEPPGSGEDLPEHVDALLMRLLGGRAAELIAFGICGGGSGGSPRSDLARATLIAGSAELSWGMGDRLTWLGDPDPSTLPQLLAINRDVAARVEQRMADALASATALLTANRGALDALAEAPLERETLSGEAAEAIVSRAS